MFQTAEGFRVSLIKQTSVIIFLFALLLCGRTASAQVVVFAPHPDDEALMTSGIIARAKAAGQVVKVVLATNGECRIVANAQLRQQETVAAMAILGLPADDVIFLGYPDCGLRQMYFTYRSAGPLTSVAGRTQTFGFEGLGHTDYHSYIYGSPASYNQPSMLADIRTVLRNYRPQDVYVTSGYDDHNDHHSLNFFVVDALVSLIREDSTFQPTLHEAIVHEPCELACNPDYHWPMPAFTPDQLFPAPPYLSMTPLLWSDVESVIVPTAMQSMTAATNQKDLAINAYQTQANVWLHAFVKHDEVFWRTELWSNLALRATATASSATSANGASADHVNDGSVSGGTRKPDGEWVSNSQQAGAWAQLTWATPQTISRIVLNDRTDVAQNIDAGTVTFSDGSSLTVGALPASGAGLTIDFAARSVTWVRFTATSVTGTAGLAEMQVYGNAGTKLPPFVPSANNAPAITAGPTASPSTVSDASTSAFSVAATDPDGDALTYIWTPSQGTITGSGPNVTFVPVAVLAPTDVGVDLIVADGRGGRASAHFNLLVTPSGQQVNIARFATATASSQAASQPASRAIDGVVDGYPGDSQKEWASNHEVVGAWIQLTWDQAQTVSRVILHDRINVSDQILTGTLRFSDGSTVAVGTLPNDGAGLTLNFATKTVTWVRLEVLTGRGGTTGLAEFEVFSPPPPGSNNAPTITSGPTATPSVITDIQTSTITVSATDPEGDPISYAWSTSGGTISSTTGTSITFTPPRLTQNTTYRVDLQVTDDRGGAVNAFVNIVVTPSGSPLNLASYATATASTENVAHNQQASKAIDGIVDGYPNNEAREWASLGQGGGGAWLQLTWPSAQSIFRVVLHDRINTSDQVTDGLLRFSDGSTVPFGTLPDDGTGLRVTFASRDVTWVRFEVGHQRGSSPGLAEIEVYATPPPGSNAPPVITSGPTANPASITDIQTSTINVVANDPTGEPLTYLWRTTGGMFTSPTTGTSVTFKPPRSTATTVYRVTVDINDDSGGSVSQFVDITVTPSGAPWNLATSATVTASSQNVTSGQQAIKAVDTIIAGYPTNSAAEWATLGEKAGAWIQLTWPTTQSVYRVILYDRVNTNDQIQSGILRFSDGSTIPVGALTDNGTGNTFTFTSRLVTWVRFEITAARGGSTGLAEFEAYQTPAVGPNTAPQITSGPSANPTTINDIGTSTITVAATDANGDPLTYSWQTTGGSIAGSGASVSFVPPRITTATTYRVQVDVTDGNGGVASGFVDINVTPSGIVVNQALSATATASQQNTSRGQTANKAIDGFVDGYPNDLTREWNTGGQTVGAWIQLTWSTTRTVSRVILHDRINTSDQIMSANLLFSDGSVVPVGTLPNDGAGLTVDFTARAVTWVRLVVTSVRGTSTGLAEFEVY